MSVRTEVLQILADSATSLHSLAITEKSKEASGRPIVAQTLSGLKNDGHVKPTGMADNMVLWTITPHGRAELGRLAEPKPDAGGGTPKADGAKKPRRARKPRSPKAPKVQRRNAKRAAGRRKIARRGVRKPHRIVRTRHVSEPAASSSSGMWALRSDGAFILLGDEQGLVLPRALARALVDFVRTLDKAEV